MSPPEHLRNTSLGAEQTWEVPSAPPGDGDLVVRVATTGQRFIGATHTGLHFSDPVTGLGTRYGNATWIEADGSRHGIVASIDGGTVSLRIPSDLVDESQYPVTLDPVIGAEYAMDAPIYGPAPDLQTSPSVGHSGAINDDFLVVWHDRRGDIGVNYDVYAAHVNRSGTLLDPVGFLVTQLDDGVDHEFPNVVWSGADNAYAVVYLWKGPTTKIQLRVIPGATSTTPAAADIQLDTANPCNVGMCSTAPDLASNQYVSDNRLMAVWKDSGAGVIRGITFKLTNTGGTWGVTPPVAMPGGPATGGTGPYVSGSNQSVSATNFLVTWADGSGSIQYRVIDKNALLVSQGSVGTASYGGRSGFFGDSNSWFVVTYYVPTGGSGQYDIAGTEISNTGLVLNTMVVSNDPDSQILPSVIGLGKQDTTTSQVFVVWQTLPSSGAHLVRGRRVTTNKTTHALTALDTAPGILLGGVSDFTDIDGHSDDNDRYFVAWGDMRFNADVYGTRVPFAGGTPMDPVGGFLISRSANREVAPAIGKCGTHYLVAWSDTRDEIGGNGPNIYGSILNSNGTVAVQNVAISTAAGKQDLPAIGCNGTNFYVVWVDERSGNKDIYGNGINASTGAKLFASDLALANTPLTSEDHPAIAFGSGNYVVAYQYGTTQVRDARVNATTGALVDTGKVVSQRPDLTPDIDFDGTNFLVVAQRGPTGSGNADIVGTLVDTTNTVVGTTFNVETAAGEQRYPRVRWDGVDAYTVIYEDDRNFATTKTDIYARLVKNTGAVLAANAIANTTDNETVPQIAQRSGTLLEAVYQRGASTTSFEFGIWGQSLLNGVMSGASFIVSNATGTREMTPAMSCISATSCVVPYRWFNPTDTTTDVDRIKARVLTY